MDRSLITRNPPALGRRSFLLATLASSALLALGRTPHGGTLRLALPWPLHQLDPHALDDATAALFGTAVVETLFVRSATGQTYPTLAAGAVQAVGSSARLQLRPDLRTALGRPLDARDVVFSLERSRRAAGAALLAHFGAFKSDPSDPLAVLIERAKPRALERALASPLCSLVPRGFSPRRPDGTGPFRVEALGDALILTRNLYAARGASFLERIQVRRVTGLAEALRAFETGASDIGWLGGGLHRRRVGAVAFDAGMFGWAVLRTGRDAGSWGAPGVAQKLLDAVAPERLSHLGLRGLPKTASGTLLWGGGPARFLVADDAPHLEQIARALAALLSQPGHEIRVVPSPRTVVEAARRSQRFTLLADFVRWPGDEQVAKTMLVAAADERLARSPPPTSLGPRELTRTLRLGIIGELALQGAHAAAYHELGRWELGAVWRDR
jgi:peptide/nickel transport system substrate-binding protein